MELGMSFVIDCVNDYEWQNILFAHQLAAQHSLDKHFNNPFQRGSTLYEEYQRAALMCINGEQNI